MNGKETKRIWDHIDSIQGDMDDLHIQATANATDIKWLKKIQYIILSSIVAGFFGTISLLLQLIV